MKSLKCFKTYDVRGKLDVELDEDIAYRIGRAFAVNQNAKRVVLGSDSRLTSESLKQAVAKGLMDSGVDVIDIGMTGTEEVYFSSFYLDVDGGIEITASHNPIDYNGMKFIKRGGVPLSQEKEYLSIKQLAENNNFSESPAKGTLQKQSILEPYIAHLLKFVDIQSWKKPIKLVVNAGNGAAGHVIDALEATFKTRDIPVSFIKIHHEPDGNFPNGIPNPLLFENRPVTADAVIKHKADMGIAWDGDFDRCFLFDEKGQFIEGYYIVGLLAEAFLRKNPGEKIIHDPRLTWNTIDIVTKAGGVPIQSKTGHAFIKESMRVENAIYGGEMSAHHYFRDFAYCDSGMIPWLIVLELLSTRNQPLSKLIDDRQESFPCTGEINFKVENAASIIDKIRHKFDSGDKKPTITNLDGVSVEFDHWRFNLRSSNTEPLLRLNLEVKGNQHNLETFLNGVNQLIMEFSC
jgi:phosphomannomutase/phosphomannomutase/phosphoglucomutase